MNYHAQLPCMACHMETPTFCAVQEDDRDGLHGLLDSIRTSLARGTPMHDIDSNGTSADVQHGGAPGEAQAAAAHARNCAPDAQPEPSQSLVPVPIIIAEDASEHAGLMPVLGAWRSGDGRCLHVAFPKPAASLADLLRFDPAALGPDGAVRLLLYQACLLHPAGRLGACLTMTGNL